MVASVGLVATVVDSLVDSLHLPSYAGLTRWHNARHAEPYVTPSVPQTGSKI